MKQFLHQLNFDNSFSRLPDTFYTRHETAPLERQYLIHFNQSLADSIGLDANLENEELFVKQITDHAGVKEFDALAQCYAGHQFGQFVPRLGDGRAILLGEILTEDNEHWDIQLKGAGKTEYSRGGDGRAVLRSTIREYLCSEAMNGLGIPTTRSLCMIGSEEEVYREEIEKGAILVRMAKSHIRFGTFEYYYYRNNYDDLKILTEYVLDQHFAGLKEDNNPVLSLLNSVIRSTAELVAQWQSVGFCHGVLNTDNMSIHGITLDYGPFGFMNEFDRKYICNHSDHQGRYAYENQPQTGLFNVSCFAQTLLPLLEDNPEIAAEMAIEALNSYKVIYAKKYAELMNKKLGLLSIKKTDQMLCDEILNLLENQKVDYSVFFRRLSEEDQMVTAQLFDEKQQYMQWFDRYRARLAEEKQTESERSYIQKLINPKYILRNYLAEQAIQAANKGNYTKIATLFKLLQKPFDEHEDYVDYAAQTPVWAANISVSCSS